MSCFLLMAAGMVGTGLVCSYSRGSWLGAGVGWLALARARGKLKWRFVVPGILVVAVVVWYFWGATPDTAPWYVKRLDLGRPSAQHRVAAWRGAWQMMRDHPFGVGWNKAVGVYRKDYSPPKDGAGAITMNSYLMLGTQLGLPGLLCFLAYVALRLGACAKTHIQRRERVLGLPEVCRAGAWALLVAFWFDGGLFNLPTASVFWILLELGSGG
jgi:O-antigen ligase